VRAVALVLLLVACKDKPALKHRDAAIAAPSDAAVAPVDALATWPVLEKPVEQIEPLRVIAVPANEKLPRFTIGGPILVGDLAIVSSSQFGFAAVDFRRGQIAWTKPAGSHVAPPLAVGVNIVLVGSCINPPTIPESETLLGCMRVVTPTGSDQAYIAIRGRGVAAFSSSAGDEQVWTKPGSPESIIWKRGESAVAIDLLSGVAKPTKDEPPPLHVTYKDKSWDIRRNESGLIEAKGTPNWKTEGEYGPLVGAIYIPDQAPMIRVVRSGGGRDGRMIMMFDIDATGSLHGQVSLYPVPGIGLIGHAISKVGNTALAVRLDTSLERDYIAGYSANAALQWIYPLPGMKRPDPVGIAIAHDAVVVFHDGDTVTVLPELSAPPTAPGAVRDPSENATP
jgi:hypothetical protein